MKTRAKSLKQKREIQQKEPYIYRLLLLNISRHKMSAIVYISYNPSVN